jgi:uncharacterized repeat protein (TIGR01451 family)
VNPPFALPGTDVDWMITVTNTGDVPMTNVTVTDTLPPEVEILSVTSTAGVVTVSGQTVTLHLDVLGPGASVVIVVHTRVRLDVNVPFIISNLAALVYSENPSPQYASATVLSVTTLPRTGETPLWAQLLLLSVGMALGASAAAIANRVWKKR